jgi:putative inorganic carbon (HCO3(-)) transporter
LRGIGFLGKAAQKKKNKIAIPGISEKKMSWITLLEEAVVVLLFAALALLFAINIQPQFSLPKLIALRIGVLLLFVIFMFRLYRDELMGISKPILYGVIALSVWGVLSVIFAVHRSTALYGNYDRYNGFFTYGQYLLLFILFSMMPMDLGRIIRIVKYLVLVLVPVSLYALVQYAGIDPIPWGQFAMSRASSTIGNPVPMGALIGLAIPFVVAFLFLENDRYKRIGWGLVLLLHLSALVSTFSRGPWVGTAIALVVMAFLLVRSKLLNVKRVVIAALCIVVVLGALFAYSYQGIQNVLNRLNPASFKTDENLQGRFKLYGVAWRIVKDHPAMGVGFGNFKTVYPRYHKPEDTPSLLDTLPTRVHNGYIQTAVENGILGLLLYLALITCIYALLLKAFFRSTEANRRFVIGAFVASITGYLVQDLSGWSEIALTPFFWILLGLSVSISNKETLKTSIKGWKRNGLLITALACLVMLIVLVVQSFNVYRAEKLFFITRSIDTGREWNAIEANITEALESVSGDYYYEDMAGLRYMERLGVSGDPQSYKKAASIFERAHLHNPFDPYVLIHRIDTDTVGIRKGVIKEPSEFVKSSIVKLPVMDSNNASVYAAIAKLFAAESKFNDSLAYLNRAKELQPYEVKYYTLEGYIHRLSKNSDAAVNAYREALLRLEKRGLFTLDEWGEAKQGLVFSYLDKKDFTNALKEIKALIERFPDNVQSYLIMGDVYAAMGNAKQAKESFIRAITLEPINNYARERLEAIKKSLE